MKEIRVYPSDAFPLDLFLGLTQKIYGVERRDRIPKNSAFRGNSYFLHDAGDVHATASIFLNPLLSANGRPTAMIGHFEAIQTDCSTLFKAIEDELRLRGIEQIIGPMNGSTWHEHRFVTEHSGTPFLGEISHPDYYADIWKQSGFKVFHTYFSYKDSDICFDNESNLKVEERFSSMKIKIRNIELSYFEKELTGIYDLCLKAFSKNVLFSGISLSEFTGMYLPLITWLNEDYIWIAENEQRECVGFLFAFENKLNHSENEIIVKTVARDPSYPFNGLGALLAYRFMKKAKEKGATSIIHAYIHEKNISKNLSRRFHGQPFRTYELLIKHID